MRKALEYEQQSNKSETVETTATVTAKLELEQMAGETDERFAGRVCNADVMQRYGYE